MAINTIRKIKKEGLESLERDLSISVKEHDDRVVLNYSQIDSPKFDPVVRECRQLILRLPCFTVLSQSFHRFFNLSENPNCTLSSFDFVEEKVDGSIISLYHDGKEYCWATRSTPFAEAETPMGVKFKDLCEQAANNAFSHWAIVDIAFGRFRILNLVFELVGPANRVVKSYSDDLILIGGRNIFRKEYSPEELDRIADFLKIRRPHRFPYISIEDVMERIEDLPSPEDEGFVLLKERGADEFDHGRIKVKSARYLTLSHMRNGGVLTPKRVVDMIRNGHVDEYLLHFPEDHKFIAPYMYAYKRILEDCENNWAVFKDEKNKKRFALNIQKSACPALLFSRKNGKIQSFEEGLQKFTLNNLVGVMEDAIKRYKLEI